MATHDYVISNASGAAVRADLNNALAAIVTNNSSATAPTTTYAYQWWADTGSSPAVMKLRNAANSAWITLFQLDGEWSTLALENGTAAAPSIYFKDSGTDTGIYSPGVDQVGIATGGTNRLLIDSAGQIEAVSLGTAAAPVWSFTTDTNTGIYSPGADQLAISTNGAQRVTVDSSGRVGVGTASPVGIFTANGSSIFGTGFASIDLSNLRSAYVRDSGNNSFVSFQTSSTTGDGFQVGVAGNEPRLQVTNNLPLAIYTNNTERARIDSSGRLLVGTSSAPSSGQGNLSKIVVQGYIGGDADVGLMSLQRGEAATSITADENIGRIAFNDNTGGTFAWIQCSADATAGTNDYPGRLVFSTTADGASSPTERMRIAQNGRIALGGQGAPYSSATCDSYNNTSGEFAHAFRQDHVSGFGLGVGVDGTYLAYFYPNKDLSGAPVGSISQNGTATAYNTSSDYRLKENINAVTDGIARLQQLKPSRFNFIADPYKTVDGFIAHEVQAVVPEAINGEKDAVDDNGNPIYQGIDQSKLVPLLTAALQEAVAEINALKDRVAALEAA